MGANSEFEVVYTVRQKVVANRVDQVEAVTRKFSRELELQFGSTVSIEVGEIIEQDRSPRKAIKKRGTRGKGKDGPGVASKGRVRRRPEPDPE